MKISSFRGPYAFLSNFYPAQVIGDDRIIYDTVEHAFQAAKAEGRTDRLWISSALTPGEAKKRGRKVKLRKDWLQIRVEVMASLVRQKFHCHPELAAQLLATGTAYLEEGNHWGDRTWGVCDGVGENLLGHILMDVRESLRQPIPRPTSPRTLPAEEPQHDCPF